MPSKDYVWDPETRKAYKIGSREAIAAGFSNCSGGTVPGYGTGNCIKAGGRTYKDLGLYKDMRGNPRPDTYIFRGNAETGAWMAECSQEAYDKGVRCCPQKDYIPSPKTGYCIKVNGPTYEGLGLQQVTRNGIDYFTSEGNADDLPVPRGPFWPARTHMVDDEDYQNSYSGSASRIKRVQDRKARDAFVSACRANPASSPACPAPPRRQSGSCPAPRRPSGRCAPKQAAPRRPSGRCAPRVPNPAKPYQPPRPPTGAERFDFPGEGGPARAGGSPPPVD